MRHSLWLGEMPGPGLHLRGGSHVCTAYALLCAWPVVQFGIWVCGFLKTVPKETLPLQIANKQNLAMISFLKLFDEMHFCSLFLKLQKLLVPNQFSPYKKRLLAHLATLLSHLNWMLFLTLTFIVTSCILRATQDSSSWAGPVHAWARCLHALVSVC